MAGLRRSLTVSTLVGGFALALASCWGPGEGGTRCECGDTPMCGNACTAECGCCPRFASTCLPNGISVGRGSCYEFVPCSGPDRCVVGKNGPVCAESTSDCEAVRTDYEARLTSPLAAVVRAGAGPLAHRTVSQRYVPRNLPRVRRTLCTRLSYLLVTLLRDQPRARPHRKSLPGSWLSGAWPVQLSTRAHCQLSV